MREIDEREYLKGKLIKAIIDDEYEEDEGPEQKEQPEEKEDDQLSNSLMKLSRQIESMCKIHMKHMQNQQPINIPPPKVVIQGQPDKKVAWVHSIERNQFGKITKIVSIPKEITK